MICSLHFGFILFSKFLPTSFGEKATFERILTVLNKLKSGEGEGFLWWPTEIYKRIVRVHSEGRTWPGRSAREPNAERTCPTTRPRSPSAGSPSSQIILGLLCLSVTRASVSLRILPGIELRPQRNVSRRIWLPRQADERDREHPFLPRRHRGPETPAQRTSSPRRSGAGPLAEVALGGRSLAAARNQTVLAPIA